jgi:hypothetical protein
MSKFYIVVDFDNGIALKKKEKPNLTKNQIVVPGDMVSTTKDRTLGQMDFKKLKELYVKSLQCLEERNMDPYGIGLFTKKPIEPNEVYLPYMGFYSFKEDFYNADYEKSAYILQAPFQGKDYYIYSDKNLGFAHSAQHLSDEPCHSEAIKKNLSSSLYQVKIKIKGSSPYYIPIISLVNLGCVQKNTILGWNYGLEYWANWKSGYVEWNSEGEVVETFGITKLPCNETRYALIPKSNPYVRLSIGGKDKLFILAKESDVFETPRYYAESPYGIVINFDCFEEKDGQKYVMLNCDGVKEQHSPKSFIGLSIEKLAEYANRFDEIKLFPCSHPEIKRIVAQAIQTIMTSRQIIRDNSSRFFVKEDDRAIGTETELEPHSSYTPAFSN